MTTFLQIVEKYSAISNENGTDKITSHSYGEKYNEIISPLRNKDGISTLEIGIFSGAFVQILSEFLPNAEIFGVDITLRNVKFGQNQPNVKIFELDATLQSTVDVFKNNKFDLIIEDGSHLSDHQKRHLDLFAPLLKPGGVYVIEDIHEQNGITFQIQLGEIAKKHNLKMEWVDLRHVKGRFDDILAVFTKIN